MAIVILLLALVTWRGTTNLSELGAVFPKAIAIGLAIFGTALLIDGLIKKDKTNPFQGVTRSRVLAVGIALAMYVGLIPFIGFILSSTLFLAFSFLYFRKGGFKSLNILRYVLLAFLISMGFYSIFHYGFNIPVPTGALWVFLP